jgi:hypothetical protein
VTERAPRIAAPERELDELHRMEEALVVDAIAAGHSPCSGRRRPV